MKNITASQEAGMNMAQMIRTENGWGVTCSGVQWLTDESYQVAANLEASLNNRDNTRSEFDELAEKIKVVAARKASR